MEEVIFRVLVLVLTWLLASAVVHECRRRLAGPTRTVLDFCLAMYLLTFYLGSCWLFLWRGEGINRYYSGAMTIPEQVPYVGLLILVSLPLLILPVATLATERLVFLRPGARRRPLTRAPLTDCQVALGIALALLLIFTVCASLSLTLLDNAYSGLSSTTGLADLYARRREAFESLSSIRAGLIYGSLPACAALLLFHRWRIPTLGRLCGAFVAVLAVAINSGLFQIGPIMAFGVMCAFCLWVLHGERFRATHIVLAVLAAVAVLQLYFLLKATDEQQDVGTILQILLRMPIALPYLFQMNLESPSLVASTDSLPHELGEYLFPEFAGVDRFVAMPQPAFINAYFQVGILACLGTLLMGGLIVACGGWLLQRAGLSHIGSHAPHRLFVAVVLGPCLYYLFQISLPDVLLSSYGVAYVSLPIVLALVINKLSPGRTLQRKAAASRLPSTSPQ